MPSPTPPATPQACLAASLTPTAAATRTRTLPSPAMTASASECRRGHGAGRPRPACCASDARSCPHLVALPAHGAPPACRCSTAGQSCVADRNCCGYVPGGQQTAPNYLFCDKANPGRARRAAPEVLHWRNFPGGVVAPGCSADAHVPARLPPCHRRRRLWHLRIVCDHRRLWLRSKQRLLCQRPRRRDLRCAPPRRLGLRATVSARLAASSPGCLVACLPARRVLTPAALPSCFAASRLAAAHAALLPSLPPRLPFRLPCSAGRRRARP